MNVFVLNAGRSGSTTFAAACSHITNYTSAHESRVGLLGPDRLDYPPDHIEVDNRLSWFLGRLDRRFGKAALYVHLTREPEAAARSFVNRYSGGIIYAYRHGVLQGLPVDADRLSVSLDYLETVETNIELFLRDKPRTIRVRLDDPKDAFAKFWSEIGARGNFDAALAEFEVAHNATRRFMPRGFDRPAPVRRALRKIGRVIRELPGLLRDM